MLQSVYPMVFLKIESSRQLVWTEYLTYKWVSGVFEGKDLREGLRRGSVWIGHITSQLGSKEAASWAMK